jgi:hypothetical protein
MNAPRERHYTYTEAVAEFFAGQVKERTLRRCANLPPGHRDRLRVKRYGRDVLIAESSLREWESKR